MCIVAAYSPIRQASKHGSRTGHLREQSSSPGGLLAAFFHQGGRVKSPGGGRCAYSRTCRPMGCDTGGQSPGRGSLRVYSMDFVGRGVHRGRRGYSLESGLESRYADVQQGYKTRGN